MKICLECAEGGHLTEIQELYDAFIGHDIFFITTKASSTENLWKKSKTYYVRNQYSAKHVYQVYVFELYYLIRVTLSCFKIIVKEKPQLIISIGGGATIPLCYMGKLLGVKIIYISSLARINSLSFTGKIIYPIADLFLVQWKSLLMEYKKAKFWGRII